MIEAGRDFGEYPLSLVFTSMGQTKEKLQTGRPALGGWIMIGHPTVAEIFAGQGFDWLAVDLEHTSTTIRMFHELALAVKGTGVDLLARLPGHNPEMTKLVLDSGADGIIVPSVNTPEEAAAAVAMAKYPPEGIRGAALCRATGFGRNFDDYYRNHNRRVLVVCMLEHRDAVENVDAILATPGIDATLIGPYDLSASMGLPGQIGHPDVLQAQQTLVDACVRHGVPAGIHVVPVDGAEVRRRVEQGFRFIACGVDTQFLLHASGEMLREARG
jgi:2-keto-3-deoxy-L-rhamnonate aldolase RhmA